MITENIRQILSELPQEVELVAATKSRGIEEVMIAAKAGIKVCGENYVQEAEVKQMALGNMVKWHLIGHLQSNKAKKAVRIFDCIETIDSFDLAKVVDKECAKINRAMEVMIEVNSGREKQKDGCMPEDVLFLAREISKLKNLKLIGLMTMGSAEGGEALAKQFRSTKQLFDELKRDKIELKYLSMGMSFSYKIAITEGANMVRLGTVIFGERVIKNI
jgi:pyridoxal phosphate enzyme (YggS family)